MNARPIDLRSQAKRQISAARAFLASLQTLALRSGAATHDRDELAQQLQRLEAETEGLARSVYAGTAPDNNQA
ncbi:hypothetical protein N7373_15075 [Achromobacter mucicolens]|uniref:hypothetical protein n=1 Tax=Achromobacter mucicolens TaxID=1389922 RepID=UPI00244B7C77|nr:hypothetical protein [Achromobacter mucicolens]MDH0092773.1 hypothetical protein [Achromobacter mucicolens]